MSTQMTISVIAFILSLMALIYVLPTKPAHKPKALKPYWPTCPAPHSPVDKQKLCLAKMRQIKELADKGKYDKALALLSRLQLPDDCEDNNTKDIR